MFYENICFFCDGKKFIELGRNEDDGKEPSDKCPCCGGKGYLKIEAELWDTDHHEVWKRLYGDKEKGKWSV